MCLKRSLEYHVLVLTLFHYLKAITHCFYPFCTLCVKHFPQPTVHTMLLKQKSEYCQVRIRLEDCKNMGTRNNPLNSETDLSQVLK